MTKRMLIDATHAEEIRVVMLDGSRLEDFDVETSTKRQLKGNIYLAKVVRVEPSLQAAFVEYGGGRHGFLAFGEIHPDYYQIPVADRQRLLELQAEEARREQEEDDRAASEDRDEEQSVEPTFVSTEADEADPGAREPDSAESERDLTSEGRAEAAGDAEIGEPAGFAAQPATIALDVVRDPDESAAAPDTAAVEDTPVGAAEQADEIEQTSPAEPGGLAPLGVAAAEEAEPYVEAPPPELIGGDHDGTEDRRERRAPSRFTRNYKIQEVIKRRQILLVQVVKEERGTKGAALTTYLSLAGRYCVLMPNSPRGGGISRKITSPADRRRLKEATAELDLPKGMGLIVRTAGANRPKPEIKRDCEYLLRLWDDIREHTMHSIAPAQIYEEASLIKRSIRDVYSRDVDELIVDGEDGWRAARDFMRMLMPSHAKKVQLWSEPQPLFARFQVDAQLDSMMMPTVQLRSGGYLVINQTEALVAIDVNSGRSTRERGIEETALRTNLEAADEAARQLRLRDLAGLVVIDFIDMESKRNNTAVEKRMKDALKLDRARIQLGHISHFGLLEMSRQRLRPSLAETNFIPCPHCAGLGHVRSTESAAIHVLRGIEEEAAKRRAAEMVVHVALPIAMYIFNHKRDRLDAIEQRHSVHVGFAGDETLISPQFRIDRVRAQVTPDSPLAVRPEAGQEARSAAEHLADEVEADAVVLEEEDEEAAPAEPAAEPVADVARNGASSAPAAAETAEEGEQRRKRRRRRRRGPRSQEIGGSDADGEETDPEPATETASAPAEAADSGIEGVPERLETAGADDDGANRRRGRRGRGRNRRSEEVLPEISAPGAEQPDLPPVYAGPTPADPFGGQAFDIFDVLERAEAQAVPAAIQASPRVAAPAPQPTAESAAESAPVSPSPANDPTPTEPAVKPIVIGAEEAPAAPRKRGWWRR